MRTLAKIVLLATGALLMGACEVVGPQNTSEQTELHQRAGATLDDMKLVDPTLEMLLNASYAYVVFPGITSAAVGVGGAYGDGEVYQKGKLVGYADVSQGSVGVQLGGQSFSELILFRTELAYVDFRTNPDTFDARASAIAASSGAARAADYNRGVLVIVEPQGGLMFQAAVGMQSFRFRPVGP